MGNSISTSNTETLQDVVDYIATDYILTMSYQNLEKLDNPEYCNDLVMLTSDILKQKYNYLELNSISQRNNQSYEKVKIFNKTADDLDPQKKQQVCNHISKFYVKIAHIFAAILKTINPVYSYNVDGVSKNATFYEKYKIPKDTIKSITNHGFCSNRINDLIPITDHLNPSNVYIQPKSCNNSGSITDEPGIVELMDLYYDEYDENGKFSKMSESSQQLYKSNLKLFYTTFTGKDAMDPAITKFNDIKFKDYRKSPYVCNQNKVQINTSDDLFIKYASNLANMIDVTNKNQNALLKILDKMFVYRNIDNTQQVSINPKLDAHSLQGIVVETRQLIIRLYLTCEENYLEGIKIYESIVENNIRISLESQIKFLQKEAAKYY